MNNYKSASQYFETYHIVVEVLEAFDVREIQHKDYGFGIVFPYLDGSSKTCYPNALPEDKWKSKNSDINTKVKVFGYSQLPAFGEMCFITGGEKDVLSFASYGFPAICFNSETSNFNGNLIHELKSRFDNLIVCFDNDKTGVNYSLLRSHEYGLSELRLPAKTGCKDISDFRRAGLTIEELNDHLQNNLITHSKKKSTYTAGEIIDGKLVEEKPGLITGILPSADVVGLVGGSQSGKSLFCTQLLISLAIGKPFLGFKLNKRANSVYISLEDNEWAIRSRLIKQLKEKTKEEVETVKNSITFIFTPDDVDLQLQSLLKKDQSIGIVIIDPIAEIMKGSDLNNPIHVRDTIQKLREICREFGLTIIYLHHVAKSAESNGSISKLSITGSHAFEASSRLILQMHRNKDGSNRLAITKGNYVKNELKYPENYLQLMLDESTLDFKRLEPIKVNNEKRKMPEIDWFSIFDCDFYLTTKEIKERVYSKYGISERSIERIISEELSENKISLGKYQNPLTIL